MFTDEKIIELKHYFLSFKDQIVNAVAQDASKNVTAQDLTKFFREGILALLNATANGGELWQLLTELILVRKWHEFWFGEQASLLTNLRNILNATCQKKLLLCDVQVARLACQNTMQENEILTRNLQDTHEKLESVNKQLTEYGQQLQAMREQEPTGLLVQNETLKNQLQEIQATIQSQKDKIDHYETNTKLLIEQLKKSTQMQQSLEETNKLLQQQTLNLTETLKSREDLIDTLTEKVEVFNKMFGNVEQEMNELRIIVQTQTVEQAKQRNAIKELQVQSENKDKFIQLLQGRISMSKSGGKSASFKEEAGEENCRVFDKGGMHNSRREIYKRGIFNTLS